MGPENATEKEWGVNYRALNDLFNISHDRRDTIKYELGVQMVEIYNEQIRDLLGTGGSQKKYPSYSGFVSVNVFVMQVHYCYYPTFSMHYNFIFS